MNDSDNKISHKFAYSGANKLKIISDKYENSFWNQNLSSDEDFFQTQKKFSSNFSMQNKFKHS